MMRKYALPVLMSLLLTGCNPSGAPPPCSQTTWQGFRDLMQQSASPEDLRKPIAQLVGLEVDEITTESYNNQTKLRWIKDGVEGGVALEGTRPFGAGFYYRAHPPSADAVITCFGAPDKYRAYFQSPPPGGAENQFTFNMFFVREGVLATAFEYKSDRDPPYLSGSISVQDLLFVPIGSPEETMERLSLSFPAEMRQQIKPWPGRWESVVIDVAPDVR